VQAERRETTRTLRGERRGGETLHHYREEKERRYREEERVQIRDIFSKFIHCIPSSLHMITYM